MPDTERIVKDLRFLGNMGGTYLPGQGDTFAHEAADEIERLQAENATLKARLTVDDAMVMRALQAARSVDISHGALYDIGWAEHEGEMFRAALEAAIGTESDA